MPRRIVSFVSRSVSRCSEGSARTILPSAAPNFSASAFVFAFTETLSQRVSAKVQIEDRLNAENELDEDIDGLGDDWPITYEDLKPYYDDLDRFYRELWGEQVDPTVSVSIDAWESYLEPA